MSRISLSEVCYYVFFVLLLTAKGAGFYDGQTVFKIFLVIAVLFWLLKMILTAYTYKELSVVLLLLVLGGIVYLVSGEKGALLYIMMITGLKNIPLKRVFKVGGICWGLIFTANVWIHAIGLLEGPFKVHDKLGLGMIIRWGLGYSHPNVLHVSYLVLVMFLIYLMKDRFNWKAALGFMLGNFVIYLYSVSSTGIIAVTFYLMLSLYWKYRGRLNVVEKILIQLVFPFCVVLSLAAPFLLQGKWFDIVNKIVNTRLNLAKYFLSLNPPTLFGVRLSEIITVRLTMDNSYVFAFVTYGIVLFIVIVLGYVLLVHKYCEEQKGSELCIILACFVGGVTEPFLFNTAFKNLSLLFMKDIVFEENKTVCLHFLERFDKEYTFQKGIPRGCRVIRGVRKKRLILAALIGFIVGGIVYQCCWREPARIIVPRSECDINDLEDATVYLTFDDVAADKESKVIGYVDSQTEMEVYSGNIVGLEHLRGLLSWGMTAGVLCAIFMCIVDILHERQARLLRGENSRDI